jgi:bifunctional N-acetylglucosamine-1-phosphate-uridyltransferase/glucosamine-1-phosphate-acetyltransferase GlmU-like protein
LITDNPRGFGRVVRDHGNVCAVVEESQATPGSYRSEVNVGIYCFNAAWLRDHLDKSPEQRANII